MKKLLFGLIATILLSNFSFGQDRLTSKDLEFVGVQHNYFLDQAINKIKEDKLTTADKTVLQDFLIEGVTKDVSEEESKMASDEIKNQFRKKRTEEDPHLDVVFPTLPIKINQYLKNLDVIINDHSEDLETLIRAVQELESKINADKDLENKDLLVLYTATNVAKSSTTYWTTKGKDWILAGNTNSTIMQRGGPGGRIVKMDIAAGVGAAATTWVVNAIPGGGQIAYGGAIAGGAVGGSVCQAAYELLDWLF